MIIRSAVSFTLAFVMGTAAASAKTVLWSIGKQDKSGRELALGRDHQRFAKEIPADFAYHVSRDAASKWPYIHPGPIDKWAGEKTHPLTIRFDVKDLPRGTCALVVNTLGTFTAPQRLEARINGSPAVVSIPNGPGDPALYDEAKAKPESVRIEFHPEMLKTGPNEIVVTIVDGAWVLYDNLQLEVDEASVAKRLGNLELSPTPCFTTGTSSLAQVVRAKIVNRSRPQTYTWSVADERGTYVKRFPGGVQPKLQFGENLLDVHVNEVKQPTSVTVGLQCEDDFLTATTTVMPQKKWKIFAQPSIHTDIGYTHRQAEVFHRHNVNLDKVKEMCRANPLFQWNIEVAWEVQNYFSDRPKEAQQELVELMQQKRLGLTAGYLNLLTALMSDEAMNHYAYYAAELRRQHGIKSDLALMTDIPSATRGLVAAMAGSGIKYFSEGCNQDRGPVIRHSGINTPFYWQGPAGEKVLSWLSVGYAQSAWLAQASSLDSLYDSVAGIVAGYEGQGEKYPFDAIYQYGAFLDNWEVDTRYGRFLKDWNSKYVYPQIVISSGPDWFEYIEKNYADKIETRATDFGAYWEDGAGSTQQETTLHMRNQHRIITAETLWSLARLAGGADAYPHDRFKKAWEDILFYAEHTWGAAQSISAPDDPMTIDQWKVKAEYAHRPDADTRTLEHEAVAAYLKTVAAKAGDVVVINPSSWPRSGLVRVSEPTESNPEGEHMWMQDVPALGSKILKVVGKDRTATPAAEEGTLENRFYRISFSKESGVTSILDKETNKELLNPDAEYGFAECVYASGGEGTRMIHPDQGPFAKFERNMEASKGLEAPKETVLVTTATITGVEQTSATGLWQDAVISSAAPSMPDIKTRVRLHENEKRISIDVTITSKTEIRKKEAVYFAFPFAGSEPGFRLGMTNLVQRPEKDFAHGACHEWYCIQDFVSCTDAKNGTEVVWTSPDVPLVCLSEINRGRWISDPELTTATIFSYAMNNYWHTNYKAGQGGDFHFEYNLTSGRPGMTNEQCVRFARDTAKPLIAALSAGGTGPIKPAAVSVNGTGVVVTTIAGAQDGTGTIVRLRNLEDVATTARLRAGTREMQIVTLVEDATSQTLQKVNGGFALPLKPQQVATVRID